MVSGQSMVSMTTKVTTIVRMPVKPPSVARTAPPTSPMSEEKREARPAGASVASRARSVPTSRANMVFLSSVSMRMTARLLVVSLKNCPAALARLSPITPAGPQYITVGSRLSKAAMTSSMSLEYPAEATATTAVMTIDTASSRHCGDSQSRQSRTKGARSGGGEATAASFGMAWD